MSACSGLTHGLQTLTHTPVFHKSDLPFARDLLGAAACADRRGGCHDHPGSDGAGGGCADLIRLDVTRGG